MTRDDQQRVLDILECAHDLSQITNLGLNHFLDSKISQRAAERLLEIIGEASNALGPEIKLRHKDISWRKIVALRHLLAHHYHRIDAHQIWLVATSQIPNLVAALQSDVR